MKLKSLLSFVGICLVFTLLNCSLKDRVALVRYDVAGSEIADESLGQNINVAIARIPDRRKGSTERRHRQTD